MTYRAILVVITLAITGCSAPESGLQLAGSSWTFRTIDGRHPIGQNARIDFTKGKIDIVIGCDRMHGPWHIADNRLVAGPLRQSEKVCSDAAWLQEKAVNALLVATPRVNVKEDAMMVRSSGHTALLERIPIPDDGSTADAM